MHFMLQNATLKTQMCVCVHHRPLVRFLSKSFPKIQNTFSLGNKRCWNPNSLLCFWTHSCITLISLHKHAHTCSFHWSRHALVREWTLLEVREVACPSTTSSGEFYILWRVEHATKGEQKFLSLSGCDLGGVMSTGNEHWPHSGVFCMNWHLSLDHSNDILSRRFGEWDCSYSITKAVFYHNTKAGFILLHQI